MSTNLELLQIERSVVLRAPRSRVWRALTQKEEFGRWFQMSLEGEFAPGTKTIITTTHPDYAGKRFPLYVVRREPESVFAWRWFPGEAYDEREHERDMTEVTFTLEEIADGTLLTVVESGFEKIDLDKRARAFESNAEGWAIQLERIAAYLRDAT